MELIEIVRYILVTDSRLNGKSCNLQEHLVANVCQTYHLTRFFGLGSKSRDSVPECNNSYNTFFHESPSNILQYV